MLVEKSLALLVAELAANAVQNSHKGLVVHESLLLDVQVLEHLRCLQALVLLLLGALPDPLKDGNLDLLNAL